MEKVMKFEEKLEELESIIKELETGEVDLDDAINKYTKAMKITKECSDKLTSVEKQVNKILTESGKLEDFNVE
ncbi:MAG: exodeoxyribonuclease VII small subunit [Bacilli bacterium]|nr:exodeoxyribonuclease VII small subunit [Bacilli bacterium]